MNRKSIRKAVCKPGWRRVVGDGRVADDGDFGDIGGGML